MKNIIPIAFMVLSVAIGFHARSIKAELLYTIDILGGNSVKEFYVLSTPESVRVNGNTNPPHILEEWYSYHYPGKPFYLAYRDGVYDLHKHIIQDNGEVVVVFETHLLINDVLNSLNASFGEQNVRGGYFWSDVDG